MRQRRVPKLRMGFTLIEILVVIVIIAIAATMALLATGDFGRSRRLHLHAEQLVSLLEFAQNQAIVRNQTLGFRFSQQGYQVQRYDEAKQHWIAAQQRLLSAKSWPDGFNVTVTIPAQTGPNAPTLLIGTDGELSPLTLRIDGVGTITTTLDQFKFEDVK